MDDAGSGADAGLGTDAEVEAFVLGVVGGSEARRDAALAVIRGDRSLSHAAREQGLSLGQVRRAVRKVRLALRRLGGTAAGST